MTFSQYKRAKRDERNRRNGHAYTMKAGRWAGKTEYEIELSPKGSSPGQIYGIPELQDLLRRMEAGGPLAEREKGLLKKDVKARIEFLSKLGGAPSI